MRPLLANTKIYVKSKLQIYMSIVFVGVTDKGC